MTEETPPLFYTPVSQHKNSSSNQQANQNQALNPSPDTPLSPWPTDPSDQPSNPSLIPKPFSNSTIGTLAPEFTTKPSQTPHFSENTTKDPLVIQFTILYTSALTNAKEGKYVQARQHYSDMLTLYNQLLTRPDLQDMNKDIAHFCLQDVYETLSKTSDPTVSRLTFGALIGMTLFILVIGGIIATNPSIVGLTTGYSTFSSPTPHWNGGEPHVMITGPTTIRLPDLFSTSDKAPLTFLSTSSIGVDAVVSGDYVTLIPKYGVSGTTKISLVAARQDNPQVTTKQNVDVTLSNII